MRKILLTTAMLNMIIITTASAAPTAVDKFSCARLANHTTAFILVLKNGDEVLSSITQCAKDAKLKGASISGVGQLHNPTLAYFSSNPKDKPTLTNFDGYYELASLTGNISNTDNHYYTHLHTVMADKKFHGIAGHLKNSKVGMTAEITIRPFTGKLERTVDANTGFGPIKN